MNSSGRGQALIPWPNRLQDGSYEFDGCRHQPPLNELDRRNAIDGPTATNIDVDACPYWSGAHPYLTLGTATVDRLNLHAPPRTVPRSEARGLPIGTGIVEEAEHDFR